MADVLFAAADLSAPALRVLAERIGMNLEQFDASMADPALDGQLEETTRWVESAHAGGLPQIWMQHVALIGVQTPQSLDAAFRRAERSAAGD